MTSALFRSPQRPLPDLPPEAKTKDGFAFDPRTDTWVIASIVERRSTFDFSRLSAIAPDVRHSLKLIILWHLERLSFSHAMNLFRRFLDFHDEQLQRRNEPLESIDLSDLLNYRASLNNSTEWKLSVLRILLEDMERMGLGISTRDALEYLSESTIRGNIKGTSVRTRDPEKGAFTDLELLAIQSSLNDAYAGGTIDLYGFAVAWLFLAYGPRPVQIAAMKESDLVIMESDGGKRYALKIPRAKQRGGIIRGQFKTRYCSKQIGQLLETVLRHNAQLRQSEGLEGHAWPLFQSNKEGHLPGLKYHRSSKEIGRMLIDEVGRITGLTTNSRRFRITLAQRAVDDGKDKFTIAEMLDHLDTQNIEVYFEASPAIVLRLDRHLAMELAPLAQAFSGVMVKTEDEAKRGGDRSGRIYDRSLTDNANSPLGTCGQMSFCGLAVPIACYTCRHFQPWLDGPHEEFMAALIADRERMIADRLSAKIYTIRDRTILAVAEVIQLCASELAAREGRAV